MEVNEPDMELFAALYTVSGFTLGRRGKEQVPPHDSKKQRDQEELIAAFPSDWVSRSRDEFIIFAEEGLREAQSDDYRSMTPTEIADALWKYIHNNEK